MNAAERQQRETQEVTSVCSPEQREEGYVPAHEQDDIAEFFQVQDAIANVVSSLP